MTYKEEKQSITLSLESIRDLKLVRLDLWGLLAITLPRRLLFPTTVHAQLDLNAAGAELPNLMSALAMLEHQLTTRMAV